MDPFRTALPVSAAGTSIHHQTPVLSMGSCFAEHISHRLQRLKFPVLNNPGGILYNPASIAAALHRLLDNAPYCDDDLTPHEGLWHSLHHHGSFSHEDKEVALEQMNTALSEAASFLRFAKRLLVTVGSAHVFRLKESGCVVANCHKLPGQLFWRQRLSVEEAKGFLFEIFTRLKEAVPDLEIIATVSPVRHLRDGLVENNLSKATLLLALDGCRKALPYVHYFPAYELLLDDLRDYRFFAGDLCHPSPMAVDYVWSNFELAYFEETTQKLCEHLEGLASAVDHRPLHPGGEQHRRFVGQQRQKCLELERQYPHLDFSKELAYFQEGPG